MCWEGRGDEKSGYLKMVTTLHFPHGTEVYEGVGSPQGSVVKDQSEDRFSPVSSAFVCVCVFVGVGRVRAGREVWRVLQKKDTPIAHPAAISAFQPGKLANLVI